MKIQIGRGCGCEDEVESHMQCVKGHAQTAGAP